MSSSRVRKRFAFAPFVFGALGLSIVFACARPATKRTKPTEQAQRVVLAGNVDAPGLKDPALRALCGPDHLRAVRAASDDAPRIVCDACPKLERDLPNPGEAEVLVVARGAFTAPGKKQAIISLSGCEAHYLNYGGSFLLEEDSNAPGGWAKRAYFEGWVPRQCLIAPRGKADPKAAKTATKTTTKNTTEALICETAHEGQGVRVRALHAVAFTVDARRSERKLIEFGDNLGVGVYLDRKIFAVDREQWLLEPVSGTEHRLTAKLRLREGTIPAEKAQEVVDLPESFITRNEERTLTWSGSLLGMPPAFKPDAKSRSLIDQLEAPVKGL